jgi:transposase-like protein
MKKRIKFSKEFKLKAVHLSEKSDNIQDVAISLGISGGLSMFGVY